ncbi:MAG: hypothetical protein PHG00_16005 [Methylococcales bacterium]|nr:hypothetical protein [Methylococcales bacterium]
MLCRNAQSFSRNYELVGATLVVAPDEADVSSGAGTRPASTLADVVGPFKSLSTNEYIKNVKQNDWRPFSGKLCQRNYYEHIIRNDAAYLQTADYIQTNPQRWFEGTY